MTLPIWVDFSYLRGHLRRLHRRLGVRDRDRPAVQALCVAALSADEDPAKPVRTEPFRVLVHPHQGWLKSAGFSGTDIRFTLYVVSTQYASTEPRQTLSGNPKLPPISHIFTAMSRTASALVSSNKVRIASTKPLQPSQARSILSYDRRFKITYPAQWAGSRILGGELPQVIRHPPELFG